MCRSIRKVPGKKSVKINVYIPEPLHLNKETARALYSDRYNALLGLLSVDEYIRPFLLRCPSGCTVSLEDIMGEDAYNEFNAEIVLLQEKRVVLKGKSVDAPFIDSITDEFYCDDFKITREDFRFYVEAKIKRMAQVSEARETGAVVDVEDVIEASDLRDLGFDHIKDKGRKGRSWVLGSISGLSAEMLRLYRDAVNTLQKDNRKQAQERHEMVELSANYHEVQRALIADRDTPPPVPKVQPGDWVKVWKASIGRWEISRILRIDEDNVEIATYPRVKSLKICQRKGFRRWKNIDVEWREKEQAWMPGFVDARWCTNQTQKTWSMRDDAKVQSVKLNSVCPA
jgi:hypothetical protein